MKENWLSETLCSFGEKIRVELGPQLIELKCTHGNLQDNVTSPHYRIGGSDALGRVIMPEKMNLKADTQELLNMVEQKADFGAIHEGETMTCVDWRCKHKPKVWKIYRWQETGQFYRRDSKDHKRGDPIMSFAKIDEYEDKDKALSIGLSLAQEM